MGVPITFLDKYNPEQFEIIGHIGSVAYDGKYSFANAIYINKQKKFKRILIKYFSNYYQLIKSILKSCVEKGKLTEAQYIDIYSDFYNMLDKLKNALFEVEYVEVPNNAASLKPGDIRLSKGHIELYVEVNGVGKIASASHGQRTADISNFYENSATFKAYRLVK